MKLDIRKNILPLAVLGAIIAYGFFFARSAAREGFPGENDYRMSNKFLEEKNYRDALRYIDKALLASPESPPLHLTRGIIFMFLDEHRESKKCFDSAINLQKDFAEAYANRGILNDRLEKHDEALKDYKKALELNPRLSEGPGRLWRIIRNIHEKQPTILERSQFIESELKKPEFLRNLKFGPMDKIQQMRQPGKIL